MRDKVCDLNHHAQWTIDRINALESIAYQQKRDVEFGSQANLHQDNEVSRTAPPGAPVTYADDGPTPCFWDAETFQLREEKAGVEKEAFNVDEEVWSLRSWGRPNRSSPDGQGWGASSRSQSVKSSIVYDGARSPRSSVRWDNGHPSYHADGWGGNREKDYCEETCYSSEDDWANTMPYERLSQHRGDTSKPADNTFWFNSSKSTFLEQYYNVGASRSFGLHRSPPPRMGSLGRRMQHSSNRSFDRYSRTPIVETILDDDEFAPFATRVQNSDSSWDVVSAQPRASKTPSAFQTPFGHETSVRHPQSYRTDYPISSRTATPDPTTGIRMQGRGAPPSSWGPTRDNVDWGGASITRRRSSKGSRGLWRMPTTPSKWEGETGSGSGGWGAGREAGGWGGQEAVGWN